MVEERVGVGRCGNTGNGGRESAERESGGKKRVAAKFPDTVHYYLLSLLNSLSGFSAYQTCYIHT